MLPGFTHLRLGDKLSQVIFLLAYFCMYFVCTFALLLVVSSSASNCDTFFTYSCVDKQVVFLAEQLHKTWLECFPVFESMFTLRSRQKALARIERWRRTAFVWCKVRKLNAPDGSDVHQWPMHWWIVFEVCVHVCVEGRGVSGGGVNQIQWYAPLPVYQLKKSMLRLSYHSVVDFVEGFGSHQPVAPEYYYLALTAIKPLSRQI